MNLKSTAALPIYQVFVMSKTIENEKHADLFQSGWLATFFDRALFF